MHLCQKVKIFPIEVVCRNRAAGSFCKRYGVDPAQNENDHYGLRYAEFVVPLVKAVQEQQVMIEELKKEIEELKRR